MHKVSVYSPCFNATETLPRHVGSILKQSYPVWEVLTVPDGGDPEAWIQAEKLGIGLHFDHGRENRGLAASCNTALKNCTGDFLAKVDSDVLLAPFWLERCMVHFRDDKVAGVGGRMLEPFAATLADRWRKRFMAQHSGEVLQINPALLYGADCVFRVSALQEVGGWNPKYRTNFEDVDLQRRLTAAGYLTVYEPRATCCHLRHDGLADVMQTFWKWWQPVMSDQIGYDSFDKCGQMIQTNCQQSNEMLAGAMRSGDVELTYPCLLSFFWRCFADLNHLAKSVPGLKAAVVATQTAMMEAMSMLSLPKSVRVALWNHCLGNLTGYRTDAAKTDPRYLATFAGFLSSASCGIESSWALERSLEVLNIGEANEGWEWTPDGKPLEISKPSLQQVKEAICG
jgi:hypothetical protein